MAGPGGAKKGMSNVKFGKAGRTVQISTKKVTGAKVAGARLYEDGSVGKPTKKAPDHRAGYRPGGGPGPAPKQRYGPPAPAARGGGGIDLPKFASEVSRNYARGVNRLGGEISQAMSLPSRAFGQSTQGIDNVMKLKPRSKR